jgi:PQQ-dependent dehydrogenase (methanol/ethanol family)
MRIVKALVLNRAWVLGLLAMGAVAVLGLGTARLALAQPASPPTPPRFNDTCAACHGAGGAGGDRAPPLANSARLRTMTDAQIAATIRNGTPGGMPPFPLPEPELQQLVSFIRARNATTQIAATDGQIASGSALFFGKGQCADCHMVAGRGGTNGPDLSTIGARSTVEEIGRYLDNPDAQLGAKKTASCPGWAFCPDLQWAVVNARLKDGSTVRGFGRNQSEHDLQVQTFDGRFRLLKASDYVAVEREKRSYMPAFRGTAQERRDLIAYLSTLRTLPLGPVAAAPAKPADLAAVMTPKAGDWPSYDGSPSGNRYSPLDRINTANVQRLQSVWTFTPGGAGLQNTPVVVDGVMYVTGAQLVCALDARSGRSIWCAARNSGQAEPAGGPVAPQAPRPAPAQAAAAAPAPAAGGRPFGGATSGTGPNRGVAVLGDRVFFVSDDAYLVALNRLTGGVMWTQPLTDPKFRGRYYNTAAPLVVGDLIVSGVAGGDSPLRGFVVAFKATTGELAWRRWTIPLPGEPLAATWTGRALAEGGGGTWTTGSYDLESRTLYWAVGNPYPPTDGDEREGSNLYSNSVLALDAATGEVKWHFQFTPHDLHDWDASAPLVLADITFQGQPRKVLMQANRNGYFYVLDRTSGAYLLGKPFVKRLTWSSGLDAKGVPILTANNYPTEAGTLTCPNVRGATNWYATSYNPGTGLFYVSAAEDCGIYRKTGSSYAGFRDPENPGERYLRAINPSTGAVAWEKPMVGAPDANYGGVLTTAGGLAFHGETGGAFAAVDARDGRTLWRYPVNDNWRATAMTYLVDGRQYIAIAAGSNIMAFALQGDEPAASTRR